jgi:hypothetical protein
MRQPGWQVPFIVAAIGAAAVLCVWLAYWAW